jgi:hypothetical protein
VSKRSRTATTGVLDERVAEACAAIAASWEGPIDELAKKAGHAASTWHAWRNGTRSPKFVDLDDFAQAVGCNVRLVVENSLSTGTGSTVQRRGPDSAGGDTVTNRLIALARQLEELPEDARHRVIGAIQGMITSERAHAENPPVPAEGSSATSRRRR